MKIKIKKYLVICFLAVFFKSFANSKIPTLFEENNGQLSQISLVSNKVLFQANLPNLTIWITEKGLIYNFYQVTNKNKIINASPIEKRNAIQTIDWFRSEMLLKNAFISSQNLIKKNKANFSNSYIKGKNAGQIQTDLFEELYFVNVYQGIDWRLYIENNQVKQEFIVKPHANSNLIDLEYISTGNIDVKTDEIKISNKLGVFTEGKLICYQTPKKNNVNAKYTYSKKFKGTGKDKISYYDVKIKTENYNHNEVLVIDPILQWSTFYGGSTDEDAHAIHSDGVNTWVGGHSLSFNFPTLNPGSSAYYQGSNSGGVGDAFILKFSSTGSLIWATYFGGTASEEVLSVFSNGSNVWVAGYTSSTDFPLLNPGSGAFYQSTVAGMGDGFILKFNTAGVLQWSTYVGGLNSDYFSALQYKNNELYVVGTSASSDFPVLNAGTFYQSYGGINDGVILKFNSANNLVWSTFFGGTGNDFINTIQANATHIFIGGQTNSSNFNVLNGGGYFQNTLAGSADGFISKFTLNGTLAWSTYFGGNNFDKISSLTLDNNSVWISGNTGSTTLPVFNAGGTSYFQSSNSGFTNGFVSKFNLLSTSLKWSSYYGGTANDYFTGITNDGENVFVGGYTNSTNIPVLNPGSGSFYQNTNLGFYDGLLLQFDTACTRKLATYFGNASNDYIEAIACDISKVLVCGYTQSSFLPTLIPSGSYSQTLGAGGVDAFISVFKNCINPVVTPTVNSPVCSGSSINLGANTFSGASYTWFGPMSYFSSSQNPTIINCTTGEAGNYSLIINLANGCSSAAAISVSVIPTPIVSITTNSAACIGDTIKFFSPTLTSYTWSGVSGFTSSIQNPIVINSTSLNAGNYYLTASAGNGCVNSAGTSVIINTLPVVSITTNTNVCVGANINLAGSGGVGYNWQGPNNFLASSANQIISNVTAISQGYYVLTVTDANNCKKADSVFISISPCTNLSVLKLNGLPISLYPNPTSNILYVNSDLKQNDELYITLINSLGKWVKQQKYSTQIDVSALPNGFYVVLIEHEKQTIFSQKFIKN